jgi:DNA-binding GntR family transcriptional regulator
MALRFNAIVPPYIEFFTLMIIYGIVYDIVFRGSNSVSSPAADTKGGCGRTAARAISRSVPDGSAMAIQRPRALADDVYEAIFNKLMSLEIAPGARITVDGLVRELEVSHTPIREALGRLEGEGLVVKTHLVGYRATPQISRRQFDELYELRLLLEPDAARRAALGVSEKQLSRLKETAELMSKLNTSRERLSYSGFARLDADFHDQIVEIAGNALIRDTLAHLHAHFHIFRLMYHSRITEEAIGEHAALLKALSQGDEVGAERAMREHIERSRERLLVAFV